MKQNEPGLEQEYSTRPLLKEVYLVARSARQRTKERVILNIRVS